MHKLTRKTLRLVMEQWYAEDIISLVLTMRALELHEMSAREQIFEKVNFSEKNWAIRCLQARYKKEFILVDDRPKEASKAQDPAPADDSDFLPFGSND